MNISIIAQDDRLIPQYKSAGAAGMDLCAYLDKEIVIPAGRCAQISTGIQVAIPPGYKGEVLSRSGLAWKESLVVLNAPGTIDSDYRDDIRVLLMNHSQENKIIQPFDRIAQLCIVACPPVQWIIADQLSETERGKAGFGSTGKN